MLDEYILKKFCLFKDEQILYELKGSIRQEFYKSRSRTFYGSRFGKEDISSVENGTLYITKYRIIAQGKFNFSLSSNLTSPLTRHSLNSTLSISRIFGVHR
jgi:hypothetical protein